MTKSSKLTLSSVDNVPSHHSVAQGRDFAGRKRSGAAAIKAGWMCSWLRTGLSCPWGAVGDCSSWVMLARLLGCGTASGGPWRWCACLPPISARPGSQWESPSESGVAFLLVGVPALCLVHLSVPVHWRWRRRPAAQLGGSEDHRTRRRRRRHRRRSLARAAAAL